jgi:hypothetical protein
MARSTRRHPRKGGKRKGGTRRSHRGGFSCANAKVTSATALKNMDAAHAAAERAEQAAADAMRKAMKMNNRANETEGGQALLASIAQMNEALGQIQLAQISMQQAHECSFAVARPTTGVPPGAAAVDPGFSGRPVAPRRWWQFWK